MAAKEQISRRNGTQVTAGAVVTKRDGTKIAKLKALVPGRQTIPRAELWALCCTLSLAQDGSAIEAIIDAQGVIDGLIKKKTKLLRHTNGDLWSLLYAMIEEKKLKVKPTKAKSHVTTAEGWIKYNMTEQKYVYNELADEAANEKAKTITRTEGKQLQDAKTIDDAYLIALRIACTEARCWEFEQKPIKESNTDKMRAAKAKRVKEQHEAAVEAISTRHQTIEVGRWSRCRHCTKKCLIKNAARFWPKHPCHAAAVNQLVMQPGPINELIAGARNFIMHEEIQHYRMDDDSEPGEEAGTPAAPVEGEEEKELTCEECGETGDERMIHKCGACLDTTCILCRQAHQCGKCLLAMCEECFVRHQCTKKPTLDKNSSEEKKPEEHSSERTSEPTSSSKRPRTDLDDPDGDFMPEPDEEEGLDQQEPPEEEEEEEKAAFTGVGVSSSSSSSSSSAALPKRLRLRTKTPADGTAYEVRRPKRRPFDYEKVTAATRALKAAKTSEFLEVSSRQSAISLRSEPRLETAKPQAGAWSKVHPTHKRVLLNGILYCRICGLSSINKIEGLAESCNGEPKNSCGRAQFKKLNEGKHPVRGALTWPDGSSSSIAFSPIQ